MPKKQNINIIICIIFFLGLGFSGYMILESKHSRKIEKTIKQEKESWKDETEKLTDRITYLEQELSGFTNNETLIDGTLDDPLEESEKGESNGSDKNGSPIEEIERRIASFFLHLDKQEYVKEYKLPGRSYNEYENVIQKLADKTPLISDETESLYNMFLNIAHFYRVIGSDRLYLIRDILNNEHERMESTMMDFFLWYTYDYENGKKLNGRPDLKTLYNYASFFLNTIGGRNYLMRRDSKLRILTSYYSVLILDRANDKKQNPNGIDIRPYIKLVYSDISNHRGFIYHSEYLEKLRIMLNKYNIS